MDLILWRHAEAEAGEPDAGRALTAKGHKQAKKMARWLDRHLPGSCRILVSPAERAQQTASALGRSYKTVVEIGPGADWTAVIAATGWPRGNAAVLVVGHQPTLGEVAAFVLTGEVQPWSIKKAGIWWLSDRAHNEGTHAELRVVLSPDYL